LICGALQPIIHIIFNFAKRAKMKNLIALNLIMTGILLFIAGCGDQYNLKEDAKKIGDAMCRSIEVMNQLKSADPTDTLLVSKLSTDVINIQTEMATMYEAFNTKWGDKTKDKEFTANFRKELRKAMLDCKSLSEEDREVFMNEIKE
jgi:multisubunit Na+/H+ antiporter MnhC subunit